MSMTIQGMHEAIVFVSVDGIIEFMNQPAEELTGLKLLRARGMLLSEVFDLNDIYQRPIPMPVRRGEAAAIEQFGWFLRVPGRDRLIVDFTVRSLVADDGAPGSYVITLRNAAQRMRQSAIEAFTSETACFHNAPVAMVQLDGEGRVMRINQKLLDDSGLPIELLIGRSLTSLLADPDPRVTKQFVSRFLRPFRPVRNALTL
jgi:PAS domain-containing protein